MRGSGHWSIGTTMAGIAGGLLLLSSASPTWADQPKGDQKAPACPNVVVITNVEVNVSTWLKVQSSSAEGCGMKPAEGAPQGQAEPEAPVQGKVNLGDLFAALSKLPQVRENVVVITNVKVNVGTWLDFIGPPKKPHGPGPKAEPKSRSL